MNTSSGLRSWLTHPYSLTNRLVKESGDASVNVLSQGFGRDTNWCREVLICSNEAPCWYARTIVPQSTFAEYPDFFDQLRFKTLGELIYNSERIQRLSLKHYPVSVYATEYQWLPENIQLFCHSALWVRSSVFNLSANKLNQTEHSFYLFEIFLPTMQGYCE